MIPVAAAWQRARPRISGASRRNRTCIFRRYYRVEFLVIHRESPVAADGLDGAFFECGRAGGLLGGISGLVINVAAASLVVALEIQRCRLAAKVAVDAGDVDVESAGYVFGHLVRGGRPWRSGVR